MPGAKCDLLRHSISHRLLQWRAEGLTVSMILLTLWDEPGSSLSSTAVRLSQESKHDVPPSSNTRCCSNLSVTPVICTDIYFWLGRRSDQWGLSWHMPLPIVAVSQALWGHRTGRADFRRDVKGEWKSVCCRVAFHQDMPEAKRQVKNPVAVRGCRLAIRIQLNVDIGKVVSPPLDLWCNWYELIPSWHLTCDSGWWCFCGQLCLSLGISVCSPGLMCFMVQAKSNCDLWEEVYGPLWTPLTLSLYVQTWAIGSGIQVLDKLDKWYTSIAGLWTVGVFIVNRSMCDHVFLTCSCPWLALPWTHNKFDQ